MTRRVLTIPSAYSSVCVVDEETATLRQPTSSQLQRILRWAYRYERKHGAFPDCSGPLPGKPRLCVVTTYNATCRAALVAGVVVQRQGSIVLLRPLTDNARNWLEERTDGTWWGGALVVEPRYVDDLLLALNQTSR